VKLTYFISYVSPRNNNTMKSNLITITHADLNFHQRINSTSYSIAFIIPSRLSSCHKPKTQHELNDISRAPHISPLGRETSSFSSISFPSYPWSQHLP